MTTEIFEMGDRTWNQFWDNYARVIGEYTEIFEKFFWNGASNMEPVLGQLCARHRRLNNTCGIRNISENLFEIFEIFSKYFSELSSGRNIKKK